MIGDGLRGVVLAMWRGEATAATRIAGALAAPVSALFSIGVRVRSTLYDRGVLRGEEPPIPVVSVGNLAVGGTGKTPVAGWLAGELLRSGKRAALVTRGYGEDEVLLHRRWNPEVPVIRARRRIEGVRTAATQGAEVAIVDDGFQHRALARNLDLVLLSPVHGARARLLPRGPFREPVRALRRADRVLVTVKGAKEEAAAEELERFLGRVPGMPPVARLSLRAGEWTGLGGEPLPPPGGTPLVVTSIAEPESFASLVAERCGGTGGHLAFPDHHPYSEADAARIVAAARGRWVATTEKDAVKLLPLAELLPEARVLPLIVDPPEGLLGEILDALWPGEREG